MFKNNEEMSSMKYENGEIKTKPESVSRRRRMRSRWSLSWRR